MSEFINGDCMEYLPKYPDNHFDLAIVDPPYGDGGGGHWSGKERFGQLFDRYRKALYVRTTEEVQQLREQAAPGRANTQKIIAWDVAPGDDYFKELFRVSRNQVIWGGNYFRLPPTRCFLVWRKLSIGESFSMAMCEYAWTSFNGNAKVFEKVPQDATGKRFHPTQKPIELYEWVLNLYAKPGDKILDTHVGSGSSLIAAIGGGYDYTGFEIDPDYYRQAQERIDRETAQMTIFQMLKNT